jgi:hypothetical protein
MFVCYNKSKQACTLHSAYSLAQWLHFHILSLQYTKCPLQPNVINVFQMWMLLEHVYFLNKQRKKYVSIFLDETLQTHVRFHVFSSSMVLNQIQWLILVTFKSLIPRSEVHELGDSCHTLWTVYSHHV